MNLDFPGIRYENSTFVSMKKIPLHKISEKFPGSTAFLRYVTENEELPAVDYVHRDDYYIFLFVEKGGGKVLIDFEEYEVTENMLLCILPGQVHFPIGHLNARGRILAVDAMLVKDEFKEIFEKNSFPGGKEITDEETIGDLKNYLSLIHRRLLSDNRQLGSCITNDLISSYIGTIAEIYRDALQNTTSKRAAVITSRFKALLSTGYQSRKRPSHYASELNISPVYLNEIIKKTTGMSVGDCIRSEVVLQAKRLLFYTNSSIKEIALKLGYEDWAYFTRLFTKEATMSPTQFRKKYLK